MSENPKEDPTHPRRIKSKFKGEEVKRTRDGQFLLLQGPSLTTGILVLKDKDRNNKGESKCGQLSINGRQFGGLFLELIASD